MFKQISKLTKKYLFSKKKNVEEEIHCPHLAQISTTFVFKKLKFFENICLNKFWKWQKCIYFQKDASEIKKNCFFRILTPIVILFQKSFAAQFSTNIAQLWFFWKKQNGSANFLDIHSGSKLLVGDAQSIEMG